MSTFGQICARKLFEAKANACQGGALLYEHDIAKLIDALPYTHTPVESTAAVIPFDSRPSLDSMPFMYSPHNMEAFKIEIGGWAQFRRRPTTKWAPKEEKALKALFPIAKEDMDILATWYNHPDKSARTYCRRDIFTLLNNWAGECDKARQQQPDQQPKRRNYDSI